MNTWCKKKYIYIENGWVFVRNKLIKTCGGYKERVIAAYMALL